MKHLVFIFILFLWLLSAAFFIRRQVAELSNKAKKPLSAFPWSPCLPFHRPWQQQGPLLLACQGRGSC